MKTATELLELGQRDLDGLVAYCLTLQERLAVTSRNSSKPPSQDGYVKPKPKSLRGKTGKKSGGQPSHLGATLKPVEKPDRIKVHPLSICPCGCGGDLSEQAVLRYESRQVFDLPPQKLMVTEHRVEVKLCPRSGELVHSPWPAGVTAPVQYGPGFLAWLTYQNTQQFIPLARIGQMSSDLFGHHVSDDTIHAAMKTTGQQLVPFSLAVTKLLPQEPVVNADESGLRVAASLNWLHVLSTPTLTWYGVHQKRGREALNSFAILPQFMGRLVHDCWKTYLDLPCLHALCVAHLLRELIFIHEECDQAWARTLADLLLDMNRKREEQKLSASCFLPECLEQWHRQYQGVLQQGRAVNPPILPLPNVPKKRGRKKQTKAQNLLDRLENHEEWVLAFLHDFQIPFTNNLAEQDIRMIKVKQKVSGSFRTFEGAELFATIRSYISTVRKQGRLIFQDLKAAIAGNPFIPDVSPIG
ncbi:MAG: IS66 family transposase [Proteobacteria bacterium]|nr:IS66 family transposase [Pseudomonadota bacterium]MBU4297493.1 IS66 family transposase [Pseudomonadota bacterium]MCG2749264.1 IS66 family transposase [Desulfobulbaceae bacterium]